MREANVLQPNLYKNKKSVKENSLTDFLYNLIFFNRNPLLLSTAQFAVFVILIYWFSTNCKRIKLLLDGYCKAQSDCILKENFLLIKPLLPEYFLSLFIPTITSNILYQS